MGFQPRYYVTFALAVFEMLFFGGLIYGWASLVYVFKEEGYFGNLCQVNETVLNQDQNATMATVICDAQDANFNLVFTIGTILTLVFIAAAGYAFDTFGSRFTRILGQ